MPTKSGAVVLLQDATASHEPQQDSKTPQLVSSQATAESSSPAEMSKGRLTRKKKNSIHDIRANKVFQITLS